MVHIDRFLNDLKTDLSLMSEQALEMIALADAAIQEEDIQKLNQIFIKDKLVDSFEKQLDKKAVELLALTHPVAGDLRQVYSIIKVVVDIERIGDECKNLARELEKHREQAGDDKKLPAELKQLSTATLKMLNKAMQSLLQADSNLAREVIVDDDLIDTLEYKIIQKENQHIRICFAARSLERIADHGTNIAENIIYALEGVDLRHENTLAQRQKNLGGDSSG